MKSKWLETKPYDMDEEVKKLQKKMKEIKKQESLKLLKK